MPGCWSGGCVVTGDCEAIVRGFGGDSRDRTGEFEWSLALEDVHMNIEARLTSGSATPASDCTLAARATIKSPPTSGYICATPSTIQTELRRLLGGLANWRSARPIPSCPGFTLQVAQPGTFGHRILLAWFEMSKRDYERSVDCRKQVNVMPLGALRRWRHQLSADRHYTAQLLDFAAPAPIPWMRSATAISPSIDPPPPRF